MSINVVVSSTAAGVSVSGGTSVAITVSGSTAAAVTVGGGIGPAGFLINPGTATNAFGTFQLTAGDGITISTSAAQFQISSYGTTAVSSFAPVQSVAGRTGSVVLQASDVTAGTFAVARIPTISYTALSNVPATFSPSAHTHSTSDVMSFTAAAAAAAPVQSVAGRSGAVSLAVADISGLAAVASSGSYTSLQNVPATFAPSAHTHGTADITGITSSFAAAGHTHDAAAITSGVLELARIPTIGFTALSGAPTTFAPSAHTHSTADITGITGSFAAAGHTHDAAAIASGVLELARIPTIGYTALSGVPTSFSPSVHTHSTADVVGLTASFSQLGHIHSTADITGYSSLPAQGGKAGPLVTDGTAATWTTRYSVVDPVLVQGSGMTLTRDTSAGSITVAFAGGTSGVSVSSATPQPLGTAAAGSSGDAARADHVHLMPSAADVGAAATGHSHPYVQVLNGLTGTIAISGGEGVTVSTASSSITIAAAGSYSLPTASSSVLGGIKVGTGLTITSGVLAATGGGGGSDARWDLFLPPAPSVSALSAGDSVLNISWVAPTVLAQTPITDYKVEYSYDGGASWVPFTRSVSTATTFTSSVVNGTTYYIHVAAVNGVGQGAWSSMAGPVTPNIGDSFFSSVALLLHADGNFTDFSGSPKTAISRPGYNTVLTNGSPKFGSASFALGGNGEAVQVTSTAFNRSGSAPFTCELWFKRASGGQVGLWLVESFYGSAWDSRQFKIFVDSSDAIRWSTYQGGSNAQQFGNLGGTATVGQWHHLAVCREEAGAVRVYLNGSLLGSIDAGTAVLGTNSGSGNADLLIGDYFNGEIDEVRWTNANRYTGSTITVPTAAYLNS